MKTSNDAGCSPVTAVPQNSVARSTPKVIKISPAGKDHQVVTIQSRPGSHRRYRRTPCSDCPWRVDATGEFPAEAFRHSARTAYDMASETFACHQAGQSKPMTCAGFLLRGADHNLAVRLSYIKGEIANDLDDGGHELHENYREMAIANGVSPDDPILVPCR